MKVSSAAILTMATSTLILSTSALSLSGTTGGSSGDGAKTSLTSSESSLSSTSLLLNTIVSDGKSEVVTKKKCTHDHHHHHDEITPCSGSGSSSPRTVTMIGGRTLTLSPSQQQALDLYKVDVHFKEKRKEEGPSVIIPATECPDNYFNFNKEVWSNLSPLVWTSYQATKKGIEMKCEWNVNEDMFSVARVVVQRISSWFVHSDEEPMTKSRKITLLTEDVLQSMLSFKEICESNLNNIAKYRIKISAMYGDTCTRCPAYHTDYVPMRWIQTLYGPGCVYVDPLKGKENMFIQRIMENGMTKSSEWKERQVAKSGVKVEQTQPGQPVVLVGHAFSTAKKCHLEDRPGVLHRSPHNAAPDQGRVLLTLDVDIHNGDDDDDSVCKQGCCS